MYEVVCDLCGKRIEGGTGLRRFKIKEKKVSFSDVWWEHIDAHDECVRRLYEAAKSRRAGDV